MTAPSQELVEEIAQTVYENDHAQNEFWDAWDNLDVAVQEPWRKCARAVLSSSSIARALEMTPPHRIGLEARLAKCDLSEDVTPQATGLSAIAQERDEKVTRFEVIDENGRAYVRHGALLEEAGVSVILSYQDHGRTLKVFVALRPPIERSEIGEAPVGRAVNPQSSLPPAQDDSA